MMHYVKVICIVLSTRRHKARFFVHTCFLFKNYQIDLQPERNCSGCCRHLRNVSPFKVFYNRHNKAILFSNNALLVYLDFVKENTHRNTHFVWRLKPETDSDCIKSARKHDYSHKEMNTDTGASINTHARTHIHQPMKHGISQLTMSPRSF